MSAMAVRQKMTTLPNKALMIRTICRLQANGLYKFFTFQNQYNIVEQYSNYFLINLISLKYQEDSDTTPLEVTDGQFRAEEFADTSIVAKLSASESITDDLEAGQLEEASTITEGNLAN